MKQRWHVLWPGSSSPRGPGRWGQRWVWVLCPCVPAQEAGDAGRRMAGPSSSPGGGPAAPSGLPPLPHLTVALLGSGASGWLSFPSCPIAGCRWRHSSWGAAGQACMATPGGREPVLRSPGGSPPASPSTRPPVFLERDPSFPSPSPPLPPKLGGPPPWEGCAVPPVRPPPWESEG